MDLRRRTRRDVQRKGQDRDWEREGAVGYKKGIKTEKMHEKENREEKLGPREERGDIL